MSGGLVWVCGFCTSSFSDPPSNLGLLDKHFMCGLKISLMLNHNVGLGLLLETATVPAVGVAVYRGC